MYMCVCKMCLIVFYVFPIHRVARKINQKSSRATWNVSLKRLNQFFGIITRGNREDCRERIMGESWEKKDRNSESHIQK